MKKNIDKKKEERKYVQRKVDGEYKIRRVDIHQEIKIALREMETYGTSKHLAKEKKTYKENIYAYDTARAYNRDCQKFAQYVKSVSPKGRYTTLEDARPLAKEYIQKINEDNNISAHTVKSRASALAKLYETKSTEFGKTKPRQRQNITRSRGKKDTVISPKTGKVIKNPNALHFSVKNHQEIVNFARATGLRRSELAWVRGIDLVYDKGVAHLHIEGKGGKDRLAMLNGPHAVEIAKKCEKAGRNLLFPKLPKGMDVHKYRGMYAVDLYKQFAKPVDKLAKGAMYRCRGDKQGIIYDKDAMKIVTKNLGHNRISVIASNYLYGLDMELE